jgi:8-hydroxy-5-deazaflavin:NADPH oxidoreductase
MRIGIIGAGNVGTGLGKRLAARGHELVVSFSRSQEALDQAVTAIGGGARTGSVAEAALHGDVVVLATPWTVTLAAVREAGSALDGKVVWDCTNPMLPDMLGLALGTTTSGGEEVAAAVAGARVVKAVPPFAEVLHSTSTEIGGSQPSVFVCGDDAVARKQVAHLVAETGADPVDAGPLRFSRYTEPLGMLLVQLAYAQGMGARIGAKLLRDDPKEGTR